MVLCKSHVKALQTEKPISGAELELEARHEEEGTERIEPSLVGHKHLTEHLTQNKTLQHKMPNTCLSC